MEALTKEISHGGIFVSEENPHSEDVLNHERNCQVGNAIIITVIITIDLVQNPESATNRAH